jgi:hypothetical protein
MLISRRLLCDRLKTVCDEWAWIKRDSLFFHLNSSISYLVITVLSLYVLANPSIAANCVTIIYFPDRLSASDITPRRFARNVVIAGDLHKISETNIFLLNTLVKLSAKTIFDFCTIVFVVRLDYYCDSNHDICFWIDHGLHFEKSCFLEL